MTDQARTVPRLCDVAALAGVSRSTVSNVLNHPERVARPTREDVESVIVALGFEPDETARALRSANRAARAPVGHPPISVREVAAAAYVSVGTVSNVLNKPHLVRAATRERVNVSIARLGWVANHSAQQLRRADGRTGSKVIQMTT